MAGRRRSLGQAKAWRPAIQPPNAKYWRIWTTRVPSFVTRSHQWHWNLRSGSVLRPRGPPRPNLARQARIWPDSLLSPDSWRAWRFPLAPESVSLSPEHHAHALPPVALTSWFGPFPCQHFRHRPSSSTHPLCLSLLPLAASATFPTSPFSQHRTRCPFHPLADLRFNEKAGNAELNRPHTLNQHRPHGTFRSFAVPITNAQSPPLPERDPDPSGRSAPNSSPWKRTTLHALWRLCAPGRRTTSDLIQTILASTTTALLEDLSESAITTTSSERSGEPDVVESRKGVGGRPKPASVASGGRSTSLS
jgi:hypothetical protein